QHRREQPRTHQRRLAAPRGAHDGDEAVRAQPAEQVFDLLVPAEEQVVFFGQKAAQAGKRIAQIKHANLYAVAARAALMRSTMGRSAVGSNRVCAAITSARCVLKRCFWESPPGVA